MIDENDTNKGEALDVKVEYFFNEKEKVHLKHKDKYFLNGWFLKPMRKRLWLFVDDKMGEVIIHTDELRDVQVCKTKGEGDGNRSTG